jgi:hypothetical protein
MASFTSVDNVKLYLDKDTLATREQMQVEMLIAQVDGSITNYCGWKMLETDYEGKRFNGTGESELDLKVYPLTTLTKVEIEAADGALTDITSDVSIVEDTGVIYLKSTSTTVTTFTAGSRNVIVDFTAGYSDATLPAELSLIATQLVVMHFNRIVQQTTGLAEGQFNEVSVKYNQELLTPDVKRFLDHYRIAYIL